MRILFFSSIFPQPHNALRGIYCLRLCRALAAGNEVRIISPWSWVDRLRYHMTRREERSKLEGDLDGLEVVYPSYYYTPKVWRNAYGWFMWASARRQIRKVMKTFEPECIVSYWTHPDGAVAIRAARLADIPAIVMVGGSDALLLTDRGRRKQHIIEVLEAADAVVAVGRDLREKILGFGLDKEKVHIISRGIDKALFFPGRQVDARRRLGIPEAGKVLLWVGNMVRLKGLDVLLEACAALGSSWEDFRLYLIGDGPERPDLEMDCARMGLSRMVSFVKPRPQKQLPDWYRAADLTVLPSRSEGVPNVLRESLACGTPFVASHVGGIPELAHDPVSRLVPPGDAGALAGAIREAMAVCISNGPLQVQASGTWEESADHLMQVIRPLVYESRRNAGKKAMAVPIRRAHMLNVFITVDTEVWPLLPDWREEGLVRDIDRDVYGATANGSVGISYQMEVLSKYGLKGVFFVESLFAEVAGLECLRKIVSEIQEKGHEVQAHLHPEWLAWMEKPLLPGRAPQYLKDFPEEDQVYLIAQGLRNLRKCGALQLCAFRAGDYAANANTLRALVKNGIAYDTSHNTCYLDTRCGLGTKGLVLQPSVMHGVYEFPVSFFRDGSGRYRHAQLVACSWLELKTALFQAWRQGWYSFVIVSHSFELLKRRRQNPQYTRRDQIVVKRFEKLCQFLALHRDKFRTSGFFEIAPDAIPSPPRSPVLKCGIHKTVWRWVEQAARRVV